MTTQKTLVKTLIKVLERGVANYHHIEVIRGGFNVILLTM